MVLLCVLPVGTALADPNFILDGFKDKWSRADKPVNDGTANPARSWLWGPEGFNPPTTTTEPYGDSPGGVRTVEYFDKARMELNNPASGLVTNGLLVRELISGRLATSDAAFTQRHAADDIPVAGDPSGNDGPTYFSFQKVASLNNDNPSVDQSGQPVSNTLSKDGTTGTDQTLGATVHYVYFDKDGLKHNVPDVFWTFMNQRGNVFVSGGLQTNQPILGNNPLAPWLDAMGLPITDAYWAKVTVAGQVKDVLIQAFERRVVTYTPSNPAPFQVEMGNVGRHYYNWRYNPAYDGITAVPATCDNLPASTGGAYPFLKCGPAGMVMVAAAPMSPNEKVTITVTRPSGGKATTVLPAQADGTVRVSYTSLSTQQGKFTFNFKGQSSGKEAETYVFLTAPVDKPTVFAYPNPGKLDQDITVVVVGFDPGETVDILALSPAPNAPKLGLFGATVTAGGGVTTLLIPREIFQSKPQYLVEGDWTMLVRSTNGKNTASVIIKLGK